MKPTAILKIVFCLTAGILVASCAPAVTNDSANSNLKLINANSNSAETKKGPEPPRPDVIAGLEKQAFEAWKNKDSKFFEGFLDDRFVSVDDKGRRMTKAEMLKMIGSSNCDFKNYEFSDNRMVPAGVNTAIYEMTVTADYTCGGKKGPSPVISASVYVRSGNGWKAAYHSEVPVQPRDKKPDTAKKSAPQSAKPAASSAPAAKADPLTDTLMALETKGWEAWKDEDQKQVEDMTADQLMLVDPLGTVHATKVQVMTAWFGQNCKINSVNVSDGAATQLADDTALLTYKGSAEGICNGQPVMPLWGTTIFMKSGDTWKPVFVLERNA
jgi:hypothetical protein